MPMSPETQLLMGEILTELRTIRATQVEHGKEITRLRTIAAIAGSIGGFVTAVAVKVFGRG